MSEVDSVLHARRMALIKALKDGSYKKGRKRLRRKGRFCAQGVMCDLSAGDLDGYQWFGDWFGAGGTCSDKYAPSAAFTYYGMKPAPRALAEVNDTTPGFGAVIDFLKKAWGWDT